MLGIFRRRRGESRAAARSAADTVGEALARVGAYNSAPVAVSPAPGTGVPAAIYARAGYPVYTLGSLLSIASRAVRDEVGVEPKAILAAAWGSRVQTREHQDFMAGIDRVLRLGGQAQAEAEYSVDPSTVSAAVQAAVRYVCDMFHGCREPRERVVVALGPALSGLGEAAAVGVAATGRATLLITGPMSPRHVEEFLRLTASGEPPLSHPAQEVWRALAETVREATSGILDPLPLGRHAGGGAFYLPANPVYAAMAVEAAWDAGEERLRKHPMVAAAPYVREVLRILVMAPAYAKAACALLAEVLGREPPGWLEAPPSDAPERLLVAEALKRLSILQPSGAYTPLAPSLYWLLARSLAPSRKALRDEKGTARP